ncbi:hypothetical protein SCHPADRAFT_993550 [Schizopora paradoxa]|uniref:F-box domain-containing protein n=1 Tax=Schizopora paradoxa TaxID=27342 RepID=A0A0H2S9Z9_9AGAM|nr:hypothetical protein SCHPADRAFT_993550 [Schizopora paradoxa]
MPRQKTVDENPGASGVASGSNYLNSPSKTKRAKTDSGKPRRSKNSGKLALLLEMPIEIFTEIACYMTPLDLLNLARTSAGLRKLLMSKSSKRIWEAVRMIHNIPECPKDLSEPRYADLLYGKGCSFCPDTRAKKTYTALRIRACKPCFEEQAIDQHQLHREEGFEDIKSFFDYTLIPWTKLTYRNKSSKRCLVSQLREVLRKLEKLLAEPGSELWDYISERQNLTDAINESVEPIDEWLSEVWMQKAESDIKNMKERRSSIIKRLKDLGYDEDDLNGCYDEKGWKWGQIIDQSRPLTERVWQNVRPQLEKTIQLRRTYAGPKFYNDRHRTRVFEMRRRFDAKETRDMLLDIPKGRLLSTGDFLRIPAVVEVIEEDGCRLPLTDERWLHAVEGLPNAVEIFARTIEMDCVADFEDAVLQCDRDELRILFGAEWDPQPDVEGVRDEIPRCLNSAIALFEKGSKSLINFADILYTRSTHEALLSWKEDKLEISSAIISTALLLLEHLDFPKETTMAYMMACGHDFECLRCSRGSPNTTLSWSELVYHFISNTRNFEELKQKINERNINVPLRNAHNLNSSIDGKAASRAFRRITVDMAPTGGNAERYSTLATSWGQRLIGKAELGNLLCVDERKPSVPWKQWKINPCHLCQSLSVLHYEHTREKMRWHMKTSHGTDYDGNLLPEYNE